MHVPAADAVRNRTYRARAAFHTHEWEREAMARLGIGRDGFWAAKKTGGPLHFWRREKDFALGLGRGPLHARACYNSGQKGGGWHTRLDIGKERDATQAKRVCRLCQAYTISADL